MLKLFPHFSYLMCKYRIETNRVCTQCQTKQCVHTATSFYFAGFPPSPSPLPRIHAELLRNCPGSDPYFPPTTVWHTRKAAVRMEFAGFDARCAQRVWPVFPGSDSAPFLLLVCVLYVWFRLLALLAYTAATSIEGNFRLA